MTFFGGGFGFSRQERPRSPDSLVTVKVAAFSRSIGRWETKFNPTARNGMPRAYEFEFEFIDAIDPESKFDVAVAVVSTFDDALAFGKHLSGLNIPLLVVHPIETPGNQNSKLQAKDRLTKRDAWMLSEQLGASLAFVKNTNFPMNIANQLIECYEQGFSVNCDADTIDYPDNDVFYEFCRVFGPILRENISTGSEANVMKALTNMWKAAPPELKMKLKRDITPVSTNGELHIPYLPATEL